MRLAALAGGVGAAKLLGGLNRVSDPANLTIIGNTGDDDVFHGLHVSPDLDIVTYTLAGIVDGAAGWGIASDTTHALDQMRRLGVDGWFTLKDRDLGTHLARTTWLAEGLALSEVTDRIRRALGVAACILPMSDSPVRTKFLTVGTAGAEVLDFQDYFVRRQCSDQVAEVRFEGAASALPAPGVMQALAEADRIVVCPSNPVISIGPILAVPGIREALRARRADVVAISPIVGGAALKGPAAELLPVVGTDPSASGVAHLYRDFCGTFVLDNRDLPEAARVQALGMSVLVEDIVMESEAHSMRLAGAVLKAILA
ncbi:MAG: 2-phospho-L-lactate transferase [Acidimicrobiales bacterium]